MVEQCYDIVGDIHGHAHALRRLLIKLRYAELQGVFRHDSRKVIFVGDFVDRGPEQAEVLKIARNMCEAGNAAEILLKGPEIPLPPGVPFVDKDGRTRKEVRIKWWDPNATTFQKAAIGVDDQREKLPKDEITTEYQYRDSKPVLFGHYWMPSEAGDHSSTSRVPGLQRSPKRLPNCLSMVG